MNRAPITVGQLIGLLRATPAEAPVFIEADIIEPVLGIDVDGTDGRVVITSFLPQRTPS